LLRNRYFRHSVLFARLSACNQMPVAFLGRKR
jgi:hypothetical protein